MILSGREIKRQLGKTIFIDPFNDKQLGVNSYNLCLANELLVYRNTVLDMAQKQLTDSILIPSNGFTLNPGELYLGTTVENTATNTFVPILEGRSSLARLGIFVHVSAGLGEVGFDGHWTLEITCIKPIVIYPGIEICQVYFQTVSEDHDLCHSAKYQGKSKPVQSKIYEELTGR